MARKRIASSVQAEMEKRAEEEAEESRLEEREEENEIQHSLAVNALKRTPFRPTGLLVMNNSIIMKMIATWPLVKRTIVNGFEYEPNQNTAWDSIRYSDHEWARKAGLSTQEVRTYDSTLIAHNLIFPDGSIPKEVASLLNRQVMSMLGKDK